MLDSRPSMVTILTWPTWSSGKPLVLISIAASSLTLSYSEVMTSVHSVIFSFTTSSARCICSLDMDDVFSSMKDTSLPKFQEVVLYPNRLSMTAVIKCCPDKIL